MPKRVQRKRTKGWRMPPNTVYVGRPTVFGNPFYIEKNVGIQVCDQFAVANAKYATSMFRRYLMEGKLDISIHDIKRLLKGKDLACWCRLDMPCHGDVLLELANQELTAEAVKCLIKECTESMTEAVYGPAIQTPNDLRGTKNAHR